ncbi:ASCH domain-containing protein [Agromyces sp. Marseille-P2726]|uniref:ASCH domain-containing protein n=1 Tax=Agromyces sp. Marseille-P2726 TaxID=2709132 RepID=UPI0020C4B1D6|nr:ASCH domain-containing protein [Agromyces sp. Marseille-P2726]
MGNAPIDRAAADAMWNEYRAAYPGDATDPEPPTAEFFGDHPELTDALLALVLDGTKRATATLVAEFEAEGQPLPRVGSHWIACDSTGAPRAVLRSTELRLGPFSSVDAAFAFDEGEDDRSLESWRENHSRYWRRAAAAIGLEWSETHEILFERFSVVWPEVRRRVP